jgi:F-type H+-transporting ATPase subunit b
VNATQVLLAVVVAVEDPSQTHHWLLPETAEIIYGGLASLIIFGLLWRFAGPAARKGLSGRTARIQAELDAAAAARREADAEAARIRTALGNVGAERDRLLAEADRQCAEILAEGRRRADAEAAEAEARATAEAAAIRGRAGDELRAEIARLASAAAERIVLDTLDARRQAALIDDFADSVRRTAGAVS